MIMIRVRLNTGAMFEALAMQGCLVLIKDAKKNKAFFVPKKTITEWHNGNSSYLPNIDLSISIEPTPFDKIEVDGIKIYLESMGVDPCMATRIENCAKNAGLISLGDMYRLGKSSAKNIQDMGASSIRELEKVYAERMNKEWK